MFAVEDIEDVLVRLQAHGAELVGEASSKRTATGSATYRGPEGIIVGAGRAARLKRRSRSRRRRQSLLKTRVGSEVLR